MFWSKDFTRRAEPFPLIGKSRRKNNLRIGGVRRESRAGFKLVCTGGPYGDCCCSYAVELRGEWTVQEFVKAVLERNPCEWGFFYIQRAGQKWYEAQVKIEYQYGNLKSTVPEKIARKKIKRVHSNGGWSLMDYWIET